MKSTLGWLLLVVALAVPAVFFYNWWEGMQTPPDFEANMPKRKKGSTFGNVRSGAPSNPIKSVPSISTQTIEVAAVSKKEVSEDSRPAVSLEPVPAVSGIKGGAPEPAPPSQENKKKHRGKPLLEYNPQTNRDPTMSILDLKILKIREEERRKALLPKPVEKVKRQAKKDRPKSPPVWKQINVQGIISTPNGRAAIVNDEVRSIGDEVLGAAIKKITSSTVIFQYRGRTFYKKVE